MDNNQFGRNLKYLRKTHNETLEELGNSIYCAKSTVAGYEVGKRMPKPEILKLLATHYNIPIDILLHADLTDSINVSIDCNSPKALTELSETIFPLYSSDEAMENHNFQKGFTLSQKILESSYNGEILPGNIIGQTFEAYLNAYEESDSPEIIANLLWIIFIWWSQLQDTNKLLSLQNKMLSKKLSVKDFTMLREAEDPSITEKKNNFILDFNKIIVELLKALKSEPGWSDLADYYLALRYLAGMVDTELSPEMNAAVGSEMMHSFLELGNRHAFNFYKIYFPQK